MNDQILQTIKNYLLFKWFSLGIILLAEATLWLVGTLLPEKFIIITMVIAVSALLTLSFQLLSRKNIYQPLFLHISLLLDLLFIIGILYYNGGAENPWWFLTAILVFIVGYVFDLQTAVVYAILATLTSILVIMLDYYGVIPHFNFFRYPNGYWSFWKDSLYLSSVLLGILMFNLISAVISGNLSRRVKESLIKTAENLKISEAARKESENARSAMLSIMEDLDRSREDLEKKVKERTLELIEAKSDLEKKVLDRTEDLESSRKAVLHMMKDLKEDMLKLQELDTLKSDFVSTISHELRTPLTVIKEGVNLVLEQVVGSTNANQQECLTMVTRNIDRLTKLISNVLDISKIEAGKMDLQKQKVDVKELLDNLAASFEPVYVKKSLKLEVRVEDTPYAYADSDKIVEVLVNLVNNAYKFTEKGGVVLSARKMRNFVEITVADTGMGIPSEELPRMFQKFSQVGDRYVRHSGGTGLGLFISRNLVEAMGGGIKVESKLGQGTQFIFTLPIFGEGQKEGEHG